MKAFLKEFHDKIFPLLSGLSMPWMMPHSVFTGTMPLYDEIHVLMHQMMEIYACSGTDISRLKRAAEKYEKWLIERKKNFNRRPSLGQDYVSGPLLEMIESGGFASLIENARLASFIKEVVMGGKIFDPIGKVLI